MSINYSTSLQIQHEVQLPKETALINDSTSSSGRSDVQLSLLENNSDNYERNEILESRDLLTSRQRPDFIAVSKFVFVNDLNLTVHQINYPRVHAAFRVVLVTFSFGMLIVFSYISIHVKPGDSWYKLDGKPIRDTIFENTKELN